MEHIISFCKGPSQKFKQVLVPPCLNDMVVVVLLVVVVGISKGYKHVPFECAKKLNGS